MYPLYWTKTVRRVFSCEYKLKCVDMYKEGKYPETPKGSSRKNFIKMIRKWFRLNELHGSKVLKTKELWKECSSDEKLFFVNQVIAGYKLKYLLKAIAILKSTYYFELNKIDLIF